MKPRIRRVDARNTSLLAAAVLVSALFVVNIGDHLIADTLCCADDAFFATVAKNLATGHGYTASYLNRPRPPGETFLFDPSITLGPGLMVPAAAAIRVFGNRYWIPGAVVLTLSILLLGSIFRHLHSKIMNTSYWLAAVITSLVALNLVSIAHYEHWYTLLGEFPALLLLCMGAMMLFDPTNRWRNYLWGGFLLGWGFQIKALAAVSLPALFLFLVQGYFRNHTTTIKAPALLTDERARLVRGSAAAAITIMAFCLPTLTFETYKLVTLGFERYLQLKEAAADLLTSRGSGIDGLMSESPVAHLRGNSVRNWQQLEHYFQSSVAPVAFLSALALGLTARRRWQGTASQIPLVLTTMATLNVAWWVLLSDRGMLRHLLIGLGLWCFAAVFDLFLGSWSARKLALAVLFAAALLPRAQQLHLIAPSWPMFKPSPRTASMLEAAQFLENRREGSVIAADWWASGVDMEYLLQGTFNITHYVFLNPPPSSPILFLENTKWIDFNPRVRDRWEALLARHGARIVFKRDPYRVYAAQPAGGTTLSASYSLLTKDRGTLVIRDTDRIKYRVSPSALKGNIDSVSIRDQRLIIGGWAVDMEQIHEPVTLILFADYEAISETSSVIARPDVARALGSTEPQLPAGFRFDIPVSSIKDVKVPSLKVFALGKKGVAREFRIELPSVSDP